MRREKMATAVRRRETEGDVLRRDVIPGHLEEER
jgi:hypothetical protein